MKIFKISQEEIDDDLQGILEEHFRTWSSGPQYRWGRIETSNDGMGRIVADREHLKKIKKFIDFTYSVKGLKIYMEDEGDSLVIKANDWKEFKHLFLDSFMKAVILNRSSYWWGGDPGEWAFMEAGTRVRLKDGARHSASTDDWRETLKNLEGKEGTVDKVFDSGHTNVMFDVDGGHMIGIDRKYLVRAEHL
jgi:hypothetical protein